MARQTKQPEKPTRNKKAPSTGGKLRVRFDYNEQEWKEKANAHISLLQQIAVKEDEREATSATLKAVIKDMASKAHELQNALTNGYEMREVEVLWQFDRKNGIKHAFIHAPKQPRHEEYLETQPMAEEDYGLLIPEEPGEKPEPQPAGGSGELPNPVIPPETKTPTE